MKIKVTCLWFVEAPQLALLSYFFADFFISTPTPQCFPSRILRFQKMINIHLNVKTYVLLSSLPVKVF